MSAVEAGAGPDLVLLHGLGSRHEVFAPILDELAAHHHVVALDFPGFGDAPLDPAVRPGVAGYADWVERELGLRGIDAPHIVGSSMGGGVALELARRGVAGRVTVFSPIGFWSTAERMWTQWFLTRMRDAARGLPGLLERAVFLRGIRTVLLGPFFGRPAHVSGADAVGDLRALAAASGFDAARDSFAQHVAPAPNPAVPVVVVWGRRDVILPFVTQSRRARRRYPAAQHIALGRCGHLPFSDDPRTCAGIIARTHPFTAPADPLLQPELQEAP